MTLRTLEVVITGGTLEEMRAAAERHGEGQHLEIVRERVKDQSTTPRLVVTFANPEALGKGGQD